MVSYQTKQNKNVVLLSSKHDDHSVDINSKTFGKPEIILFYNARKWGVDVDDKYKETYSVVRMTNRSPIWIVYTTLMYIAGLISFITVKDNLKTPQLIRRLFWKIWRKTRVAHVFMTKAGRALDVIGSAGIWIHPRSTQLFWGSIKWYCCGCRHAFE